MISFSNMYGFFLGLNTVTCWFIIGWRKCGIHAIKKYLVSIYHTTSSILNAKKKIERKIRQNFLFSWNLNSREKEVMGLMGIRSYNQNQGVNLRPWPSMERKVLMCFCNCVFLWYIYMSGVLLNLIKT